MKTRNKGMGGDNGGLKRATDFSKIELQVIMSSAMGTCNWTRFSEKAIRALTADLSL